MSGVELYEQFGFDFLSNIWPLALTATKPTSSPAVKIEPAAVAPKVEVPSVQSIRKVESLSDDEDGDRASGQGDVQPVGHDYVEEVKKKPWPQPQDEQILIQAFVSWFSHDFLFRSLIISISVFLPGL